MQEYDHTNELTRSPGRILQLCRILFLCNYTKRCFI